MLYKPFANRIHAAEGFVAEAKFATGKALVFGRGTEKNIPKGNQLIETAAEAT